MQRSCTESGLQATVRISFLELRGRVFRDLLRSSPDSSHASIRDSDTSKQPHISGVEETSVSSVSDMLECLNFGLSNLHSPDGSASVSPVAKNGAQNQDEGQQIAPEDAALLLGAGDAAQAARKPQERQPGSHLVFTIHIMLQGPRHALLPAPATPTVPSQPPQPPPPPPRSRPASATRKPSASDLQSAAATDPNAPSPPAEQWLLRSTIRIVDLHIPQDPHEAAAEAAAAGATTEMPPASAAIPVGAARQHTPCATAAAGGASGSPASATLSSPRSPHAIAVPDSDMAASYSTPTKPPPASPASASGNRHLSLQTSARRLQSKVPTPVKSASIATGGEPRGDVLQAAVAGGMAPLPAGGWGGGGGRRRVGGGGSGARSRPLHSRLRHRALQVPPRALPVLCLQARSSARREDSQPGRFALAAHSHVQIRSSGWISLCIVSSSGAHGRYHGAIVQRVRGGVPPAGLLQLWSAPTGRRCAGRTR